MTKRPSTPTWTVEALEHALCAAVKGRWSVALLYRRGGQERPEDVVGAHARLEGHPGGSLVMKVEPVGRDGCRVRGACSLGVPFVTLDADVAEPPSADLWSKYARELQRLASIADGAAWKAWRKASK